VCHPSIFSVELFDSNGVSILSRRPSKLLDAATLTVSCPFPSASAIFLFCLFINVLRSLPSYDNSVSVLSSWSLGEVATGAELSAFPPYNVRFFSFIYFELSAIFLKNDSRRRSQCDVIFFQRFCSFSNHKLYYTVIPYAIILLPLDLLIANEIGFAYSDRISYGFSSGDWKPLGRVTIFFKCKSCFHGNKDIL